MRAPSAQLSLRRHATLPAHPARPTAAAGTSRRELLSAIEAELGQLRAAEKELGPDRVAWNDDEFAIEYPSLAAEIKVGAYYLRLVLAEDFDAGSLTGANRFIGQLYHTFLTASDASVQTQCLAAMAKVYRARPAQPFDMATIASLVSALAAHAPRGVWTAPADASEGPRAGVARGAGASRLVRDRLLDLLSACARNSANERNLLLSPACMPALIGLAAAVHLADPPSPAAARRDPAETNPGVPYSAGEVAERSLQLLLTLARHHRGVVNGRLVRPVPIAKRALAAPDMLCHAAQLLLSPDPRMVRGAVALLAEVLDNNDAQAARTAREAGLVYLLFLALLRTAPGLPRPARGEPGRGGRRRRRRLRAVCPL